MLANTKYGLTCRFIASLVCAYSTWALRWHTYVFMRLLPFGSQYSKKIGTSLALYLGSALYLRGRPSSRPNTTRRAFILASGIFDPAFLYVSWINLSINVLCVLGCLDFVYRSHYLHSADSLAFCRTGATTATSVKLLCRNPQLDSMTVSYCDPGGQCRDQRAGSPEARDCTAIVEITDLAPGTVYSYSASNGHNGSFATTGREKDMGTFTLLSSSCMKPNWPYSPWNHPLRIQGLEDLGSYLSALRETPAMMLFLGDFIYSDLPLQLEHYTTDYYTKLYRQIYASPSWTQRLRDIPWLHIFDDHEIVNDYAPSGANKDIFREAIAPFNHYQMVANPKGMDMNQKSYFNFNIGQVSFFVLDNRSYRSVQPQRQHENSTAGWGNQTMLGDRQMHHLRSWVEREGTRYRRLLVVVSGVPLTRNWSKGGDEFDSWAGYLNEREEILSLMWEQGGGMVISGDRHEHATTLLPPPRNSRFPKESAVIEFSTSPLSFFHQPWKRDYQAHLPTDVPIHVEWEGTTRFGVFDFDVTRDYAKVNFTLVVDGQDDWSLSWQKGSLPVGDSVARN